MIQGFLPLDQPMSRLLLTDDYMYCDHERSEKGGFCAKKRDYP
jgi:hypothetical protein